MADVRPPKLMKLSADFLTQLLTEAINTSVIQNVSRKTLKLHQ